ncbi:YwqG family protein [Chitinophaga nivalis]|uniref:YwqG family protein n=1 Tax=Chitinophaga nivalis TaxID=2991709 RepID=A0ABT3II50_9BACT|nr:YwqG family protein [Chitinophaga nivalis]MCW3466666.1 YwqG family protein [Chitinophaga nivalis]MCW3483643.1 YwqG family protein [Chitinophaga nivalis]
MTAPQQALQQLITAYKLDHLTGYLLEKSRPAILLSYDTPEDYQTPGNNRMAGYPDLPPAFEWPLTQEGIPMTFIAQLALPLVAATDPLQLLPPEGYLYFFIGHDETAFNIEHRVIWIPGQPALQPTRPPQPTILEEEGEQSFTGYKLRINAALMPPNYNYGDYNLLSDDDFDMLSDLQGALRPDAGQMWGYPEGQHADHALEAAMYLVVKKRYDYFPEKARAALLLHFGQDAALAEQEVNNMLLLLEVDSSEETGFQWWDCGCIHFFIRREDLLQRNFSNTYLSLYSS